MQKQQLYSYSSNNSGDQCLLFIYFCLHSIFLADNEIFVKYYKKITMVQNKCANVMFENFIMDQR